MATTAIFRRKPLIGWITLADVHLSTWGICKVLSMVSYLSSRFTNPIMFGIILKSYPSSMLWHKFNEDIIMQTRKKYREYMYCLYNGKRKISVEYVTFYLLKKCAEH